MKQIPQNILEQFRKGGVSNIHIISDFDKTLTYGVVKGTKVPSIISMLRDGNHLSDDYAKYAHALYNKYAPIENDQSIPLQQRKDTMKQWWDEHHALLIESGLSIDVIKDIVLNGQVRLREGIKELVDLLHEYMVPLVIMSASGCGDAIPLYFEKIGKSYNNIHYIINRFKWSTNGKAISIKGKVIHSLNKDETIIKEIPEVHEVIKHRPNIILLGDSLGDTHMVESIQFENLIKIGFLNYQYEEAIDEYEKHFDVVLPSDSGLGYVTKLLNTVIW